MKPGLRAICHAPLGIALLFPAVALAQSAPQAADQASGTPAGAAEIIVTATKQNTALSRVAAAVSAVTAADIGPGGVQNIGDLQVVVPNVSIGDQFGVNRTFIRGVGLNNFDVGGEGAVAFLQNGAILARPAQQLSGFFDLSQIEVLRGPQSILYGRGATAGAINLVTAAPTDELDGYLRATYGNYDSRQIEAAIGGPVSGDQLMVRLAGKYEKRDGYGKNLFTGSPVDDRDAYALRATVVAKLSDTFKATLVGDHFKEDDNNYAFHYFGPSVIPEAGVFHNFIGGKSIFDYYSARNEKPNLRNIYSDEEAINKRKGYGFTGTLDWDLGAASVKSITAYRTFDRWGREPMPLASRVAAGRPRSMRLSMSSDGRFASP